ncbi:nucleotide sugar dehydrogenase [Salinirubrum litoreum]|uniref:UDP-N-acetyl-D-mannosamine dehydrogenase n=1 Tax=Salinirubrum litoreum TaxID=1126234 RepID=A0ABD5RFK5_9EURY|nr:nucleotide sugar dehydrogenase [Salinirubrum litoreum]
MEQGPSRIAVIGLGYVGLPLAVAFDGAGHTVTAFDIDAEKVATLRAGGDPTGDTGADAIAESSIEFTTDPSSLAGADYVIVTVPTPVDDTGNPDLGYVESAGKTLGRHISPGTTVVLESTVYPGATCEVLCPAVETESGFTVGEEFEVGYSPERLSPGIGGRKLHEVVKIVSGRTDAVTERLADLYGDIIDAGVHTAPSIESAEAAKCVENIQRDVNIALMNELSAALSALDIDTRGVLEAAGTKWNFQQYEPGLVGGHCIPIDPYYLIYRARQANYEPELMSTARRVNDDVPNRVCDLVDDAFTTRAEIRDSHAVDHAVAHETHETPDGTLVQGRDEATTITAERDESDDSPRLLVLGLTYKPGTADVRSAVLKRLVRELETRGYRLVGYDPHGDDQVLASVFEIDLLEDLDFTGFDGVVIPTAHPEFTDLRPADVVSGLGEYPVIVDVDWTFDRESFADLPAIYRDL